MSSATQSLIPETVSQQTKVSEFAAQVRDGLSCREGKVLSPRFLYDDLGSSLFEAITLLPQYGLTRADERILSAGAGEIADACGPLAGVAELGSGSGKKTIHILRAALRLNPNLTYYPIDVSAAALGACEREIGALCRVQSTCADWTEGLLQIADRRTGRLPVLLMFLGSSIGNLDRAAIPGFLSSVRSQMRSGDFFLLGADLEKPVDRMLEAYDDPTGVTAAFNLNLLGRINRELGGDFDLRSFQHQAHWNQEARRIEMHLVSLADQQVTVQAVNSTFAFSKGESIWTESSHKFSPDELQILGRQSQFLPISAWIDEEWPLAELLWQAA